MFLILCCCFAEVEDGKGLSDNSVSLLPRDDGRCLYSTAKKTLGIPCFQMHPLLPSGQVSPKTYKTRVFLWIFRFPMDFPRFPMDFPHFPRVSYGFPRVFPWIFPFSHGFPMLFPWEIHCGRHLATSQALARRHLAKKRVAKIRATQMRVGDAARGRPLKWWFGQGKQQD